MVAYLKAPEANVIGRLRCETYSCKIMIEIGVVNYSNGIGMTLLAKFTVGTTRFFLLLTLVCFKLQGVEYNCKVRPALKMPAQMGPLPESLSEKVGEPGDIPTMADLGLKYREQVRWCE